MNIKEVVETQLQKPLEPFLSDEDRAALLLIDPEFSKIVTEVHDFWGVGEERRAPFGLMIAYGFTAPFEASPHWMRKARDIEHGWGGGLGGSYEAHGRFYPGPQEEILLIRAGFHQAFNRVPDYLCLGAQRLTDKEGQLYLSKDLVCRNDPYVLMNDHIKHKVDPPYPGEVQKGEREESPRIDDQQCFPIDEHAVEKLRELVTMICVSDAREGRLPLELERTAHVEMALYDSKHVFYNSIEEAIAVAEKEVDERIQASKVAQNPPRRGRFGLFSRS